MLKVRTLANLLAGATFVGIVLAGALLLAWRGGEKPATKNTSTLTTTTTTVSRGTRTKVIVQEQERLGVVERLLESPLRPLLSLAAICMLAFLIAAMVQRATAGSYGIKVGPIELQELAEASVQSLTDLSTMIDSLTTKIDEVQKRSADQERVVSRLANRVIRRYG